MCAKCDFMASMIEQAQEAGFEPKEFMNLLTSTLINGHAGGVDISNEHINIAVYRSDTGQILNVAGVTPMLSEDVEYRFIEEFKKHNRMTLKEVEESPDSSVMIEKVGATEPKNKETIH